MFSLPLFSRPHCADVGTCRPLVTSCTPMDMESIHPFSTHARRLLLSPHPSSRFFRPLRAHRSCATSTLRISFSSDTSSRLPHTRTLSHPKQSPFRFTPVNRRVPKKMMRRASTRIAGLCAVSAQAQTRQLHFPITAPPIEIEYLDSDPLEYAVRTEARKWGFDDMQYMRELAFVRIKENPTVGQFREMTPDERRDMFWGSDRQDFFRHLTCAVTGTPEHLYHRGW